MAVAAKDEALYGVVTGAAPATIAEVVAAMQAIDRTLGNGDGLKWFNRLYLAVTEQVDLHPPAGGWKDADSLLRLDVVFAGFYFSAVANSLAGLPVPVSWAALMEARYRTGIDRIQFALAGMNAHINHDLSLALLAAGIALEKSGPRYADYEAVNGLLNAVMPAALTALAVDCLGVLAEDTGKVGRLLAFWNMCAAREMAWDFASHLQQMLPPMHAVAIAGQDQMTGVLGRAVLAFG